MNLSVYQLLLTALLWGMLSTSAAATTIDAERMVAEQQQKLAKFDGEVELVTNELHLFSDHLVAYYRDRLGGQIDHAEATGNVRIQHKQTTGKADRAILDQTRDLLVLSGNAELTEQGRVIRGGRIEHHLKGGNTTVTQGRRGQRVHIHIDDDSNHAITAP